MSSATGSYHQAELKKKKKKKQPKYMLSQERDTYQKPNPVSRLKVKQKLIFGANSNLKKAKVITKYMSESKIVPGRQSDTHEDKRSVHQEQITILNVCTLKSKSFQVCAAQPEEPRGVLTAPSSVINQRAETQQRCQRAKTH